MIAVSPPTPTITIRDITVERGGRVAFSAERLDLSAGITALVGPNGSGKSTLLHAIVGLLEPSSGSIEVLGRSPAAARPDVAYVLQHQTTSSHLPVSVREAVELGRAARLGPICRLRADDRAAAAAAMERLEVADLATRHLSELSGGQRQRVLIAQGLAQEADVLLLDEPTAAVDLASLATIRKAIDTERNAGRTIVIATHDLGDAAASDRAVLVAGEVVAAGPPSEVLTNEHLRSAYAGRILDLGDDQMIVDDGAHHDHPHSH